MRLAGPVVLGASEVLASGRFRDLVRGRQAELVFAAKPGKPHIVFAPARLVSQQALTRAGLPVKSAPSPFALCRVEKPK